MKENSIEAALNILSDLVADAKRKGPSVIGLDNLDVLCPNLQQKSMNTTSTIATENIFCLHLERILRENIDTIQKHYSEAWSFLKEIAVEDYLDHKDTYKYYGSVSRALFQNIFFIATSTSSKSIDNTLLQQNYFRKCILINQLNGAKQISIMASALKKYNLCISETLTEQQSYIIESKMAGYTPKDIVLLAKRASYITMNRSSMSKDSNSSTAVVMVSFSDIMQAFSSISDHNKQVGADNSSQSMGNVTWKDIGGLRKIRKEILTVTRLPVIFKRFYDLAPIKLTKSILLFGPPG